MRIHTFAFLEKGGSLFISRDPPLVMLTNSVGKESFFDPNDAVSMTSSLAYKLGKAGLRETVAIPKDADLGMAVGVILARLDVGAEEAAFDNACLVANGGTCVIPLSDSLDEDPLEVAVFHVLKKRPESIALLGVILPKGVLGRGINTPGLSIEHFDF